MRSLILVALLVLFSACGDSERAQVKETVADIVEISQTPKDILTSNMGNPINSMGYYGNDVFFGDSNIQNRVVVIELNGSDEMASDFYYGRIMSEDNFAISTDDVNWVDAGYYGVSEDGQTYYEYWHATGDTFVYKFVESIVIEGTECKKVEFMEAYFGFCRAVE